MVKTCCAHIVKNYLFSFLRRIYYKAYVEKCLLDYLNFSERNGIKDLFILEQIFGNPCIAFFFPLTCTLHELSEVSKTTSIF